MSPFDNGPGEREGRRDLALAVGFVLLAGSLMILPSEHQDSLSAALRGSVLWPFIRTQESLHETRSRAVEAGHLQARLDSLVAELTAREGVLEENRRLRELLELRERAGFGFVAATAVRPGTRGSESMFLLDVGSASGVEVGDPIVTARGLAGVVRGTGRGSALAMDWTHPDFRVSVMVDGTEAYGIVEPLPGAFREEDHLLLEGIPYHTALTEGAEVRTSGMGGVYPRGIPVGRVEGVAETEAGWRRSYRIRPAVQPGSVTHVLVLTTGTEMSGVRAEIERLWTGGGNAP